MVPSPSGSPRLRRLVFAALVSVPLLAACNATPIVALNGGGGAGGGAPDGGGTVDGSPDGSADGGDASLDGGPDGG
jgi:hypothetical protein